MINLLNIAVTITVTIVALLHIYFLVLEMFLWNKPYGRKTFALSKEFAEQTTALAANQGLYNGFLAAGLIWSLIDPYLAYPLQVFFLGFIIIAGVYGGMTANRKILFVQAIPAVIALMLVFITNTISG